MLLVFVKWLGPNIRRIIGDEPKIQSTREKREMGGWAGRIRKRYTYKETCFYINQQLAIKIFFESVIGFDPSSSHYGSIPIMVLSVPLSIHRFSQASKSTSFRLAPLHSILIKSFDCFPNTKLTQLNFFPLWDQITEFILVPMNHMKPGPRFRSIHISLNLP